MQGEVTLAMLESFRQPPSLLAGHGEEIVEFEFHFPVVGPVGTELDTESTVQSWMLQASPSRVQNWCMFTAAIGSVP